MAACQAQASPYLDRLSPPSPVVAAGEGTQTPLTRELLRDTPVSTLFSAMPPGLRVWSESELEKSLRTTLREYDFGAGVHIFGYGSLMWNPAIEHVFAQKARIHGWHRSFCLRAIFARGAPETPGAMLALDRGGSCEGVLFRIPAERAIEELMLLWKREMVTGVYQPRWVTAHSGDNKCKAITFVVDRSHERYLGRVPLEETAHLINSGRGHLGTSREYFETMMSTIEALGLKDRSMRQLHHAVRQGVPT